MTSVTQDVTSPGQVVTVRLWAGAAAAAGVSETSATPGPVSAIAAELVDRYAALGPVLPLCSVLVDGRRQDGGDVVDVGAVVEVLPPFAGG